MRRFEFVNTFKNKEGKPILPTRATARSAAYDFYSPVNVVIPAGECRLIWTDVKASMESDEVLLINVRSSMGKQPVMLANTQGWIDADYYGNPDNDGNIGINLHNMGNTDYWVNAGSRIAQGMFIKYLTTDDDDASGERIGGMGSTGK